MKLSKDVLAVLAVVALAGVAFLLTSPETSTKPRDTEAATTTATAAPLQLIYRVDGGESGLRFVEVEVRGPHAAIVRYQPLEGDLIERRPAWSQAQHKALLRELSAVSFFDVEEIPRKGYYADMARVTIAAEQGELSNEVRVDGRTRASARLDDVIALLDTLRHRVTPEGVISGD